MKLDIVGYRITKTEYINQMTADIKVNVSLQMQHQLRLPEVFGPKSVGTVLVKSMIGTPMLPLYLYVEHAIAIADVEQDEKTNMTREEAKSVFEMVCMPLVMEKVQQTLNEMRKLYNIPLPEIQIKKAPANQSGYRN